MRQIALTTPAYLAFVSRPISRSNEEDLVVNVQQPEGALPAVAFISGTLDYYVRGYDVTTGEQVLESRLPAGGQSMPMSYQGRDGRQYISVSAGGHGSLGTKRGDSVIASALPAK